MFNLNVDDRLSAWIELRNKLEESINPLQEVWDFWHTAPFIPYNKNIDPYYQKSWPSPWEIISYNKYDEFTRSLMIAWTLKLTKKFINSTLELKTLVDITSEREYNLVFVDNTWVINYHDNGPVKVQELNDSFIIKNIIEIDLPR